MTRELKRLTGARRWAGVPGVTYPEQVAAGNGAAGGVELVAEPPAWAVSTVCAAGLLGVGGRLAARLLREAGCPCVQVRCGRGGAALYWARAAVERLEERRRLEALADAPAGYVGLAGALALVPVCRSTLDRAVAAGRVRMVRGQMRGRLVRFFCTEDLKLWAAGLDGKGAGRDA